jgi:uncharacterized MAPEG superfamily protein
MYTVSGGIVWVITMLIPMLVAAPVISALFVNSSLSSFLVAALPTTVERVPHLMLLVMVLLAFGINMPVILYIGERALPSFFLLFCVPSFFFLFRTAAVRERGYDNSTPRRSQAYFLNKEHGLAFRLKSAHLNTSENIPTMTAAIFIATSLDLDKVLVAKMTVFYIINRILYVVFYALNIDFLRTFAFIVSFVGMVIMMILAIFPSALFDNILANLPMNLEL